MFRVGIDGIILSQSAELIHPVNEEILRRCAHSYRRSLEDLAFAIVYGEKILKNGSLRPTDDPGTYSAPRLLFDINGRDPSILDELPNDGDSWGTVLLEKPEHRKGISNDLRLIENCVRSEEDRERFIEWLVREAAYYFGKDNSVFEEQEDPAAYIYGHDPKRPYHTDRELQGSIADDVISILNARLPQSPHGYRDTYSLGARVEFITRNMLSLVTIMRSFELSAGRHDLWRLPHVTRASIRLREIGSSRHHLELRGFVVSHALFHALKNTPNHAPESLIANLCDLRADPKISEIRELLRFAAQLTHTSDEAREEGARKLNLEIKRINLSPASEKGELVLARQSALRELRTIHQQDYEDKLEHVFPQLKPGRRPGEFVDWPGAPGGRSPGWLSTRSVPTDLAPNSVFISYAWDSSIKIWVKEFADKLTKEGFKVTIDQENLVLSASLTLFMEQSIFANRFVILVFTPNYKGRFDSRTGGVGYEADMISYEKLHRKSEFETKYKFVLRSGTPEEAIPRPFASSVYIDLRGDPYNESEYQKLLEVLRQMSGC